MKISKEENERILKLHESYRGWNGSLIKEQDEREDESNLSAGADIYNDIYDILEPVLESLYKKHGENRTIDLDDTILMVIQDWLESDAMEDTSGWIDEKWGEWEEDNRRSDGPTKGY